MEDEAIDDAAEDQKDPNVILQETSNKNEKQPTGKVVGIIKRKWRQYCGMIKPNILKGSARHIFVPAERKIPRVRIETRQAENLYNQRIIVAIDQWPRHSKYPQGHFVRSLGPIGDKDTENEVLLIEHDVPHSKFSDDVLSCLPQLPWIITKEVSFVFKLFFIQVPPTNRLRPQSHPNRYVLPMKHFCWFVPVAPCLQGRVQGQHRGSYSLKNSVQIVLAIVMVQLLVLETMREKLVCGTD